METVKTKAFTLGHMRYVFEVGEYRYSLPMSCLCQMYQECIIPLAGSVVRYPKNESCKMEIVTDTSDLIFPSSECEWPSPIELLEYSRMATI